MKKKIYGVSLLLIVIDFISKILIKTYNVNAIIIPDFFSINFVKNTGAAFSILQGYTIVFIVISIIAIYIIDKRYINDNMKRLETYSISLLIGGIIGNLIDRVIYGYVIDFISFKIFNYYFPIFNIADICITIGVILLVINIIWGEKNDNKSR